MTTSPASSPERRPAGPREPQRRIQLPQLLMSLAIVALFALLAVWWQASTSARVPALALATDVEVGIPITRGDLTEIFINTDVPARYEDPRFADLFVGVSPVTDLDAGTIITDSMFRRADALGPDDATVGIRVSSDEAPSGLMPGDRVQVLTRPDEGGSEVMVLAADARIEAVDFVDSGNRVVRLRLAVDEAQIVQLAAGRVVLIEVADAEPSLPGIVDLGGSTTSQDGDS